MSGIVLANANDPTNSQAIMTAEEIAGLDLSQLHTAVLAACETGLGDVAGGEGVFGLQRAFHLAGTRNVIGTLWNVSDKHTAGLVRQYYFELWVKKKTPLEAMRSAQLTLYRSPDVALALGEADLRKPNFSKTVQLQLSPTTSAGDAVNQAKEAWWAGFILSGAGD